MNATDSMPKSALFTIMDQAFSTYGSVVGARLPMMQVDNIFCQTLTALETPTIF